MLKKLIFSPFFLISLSLLSFKFSQDLAYLDILSFNSEALISLLILSLLIFFTAFLFVLFAIISQDIKIIFLILLVGLTLPIIFLELNLGIIFASLILVGGLVSYLTLAKKLTSYLNFQPSVLLPPAIKMFAAFLVIAISFSYYLHLNQKIEREGFVVPDALIDLAIDATLDKNLVKGIKIEKVAQVPSLTPEQMQFLKDNPELLKKQGVDPSVLESISSTEPKAQNPVQTTQDKNQTKEVVKNLVKNQLDKMLKPYQSYIAPILALMLFITLHSFLYIINLLAAPLAWLVFFILEKTSFIKFEKEMREVKKMIV